MRGCRWKPIYDVLSVQALPPHRLSLVFENGERRVFDMAPLLGKRPYQHLKDPAQFRLARVACGTVVWPGEIDIAPATLYARSVLEGG